MSRALGEVVALRTEGVVHAGGFAFEEGAQPAEGGGGVARRFYALKADHAIDDPRWHAGLLGSSDIFVGQGVGAGA